MTRPFNPSTLNSPPPESTALDPNIVVIVAALLCALICVLGIITIARCFSLHRFPLPSPPPITARLVTYQQQSAANRGLKKKIIHSLPKLIYSEEFAEKLTECTICLTEFSSGDEVRVLPPCGHGFHVGCIDTWFGSHSSCPSCRHILGAAARCQKCGGVAAETTTSGKTSSSMEERRKEREDNSDTFLP